MNGPSTYSSYFTAGHRVSLALHIPESRPFHEWAEILSLVGDLLYLRLSRDVLPVGVQMAPGSQVEVRTGSRGSGFRCRGIIVSTGSSIRLSVRLTGEVIIDELREFYRIDVYLPIRMEADETNDVQQVKEEWLRRRAANNSITKGNFHFFDRDEGEESPEYPSLPPPQAANISGGGVRVSTDRKLQNDGLVHLSMYLPLHPPVVIDAVGQVIAVTEHTEGERTVYSTALRYFHIDERDRDRIIEYITAEQLAQLRSYRKGMPTPHEDSRDSRARRMFLLVVLSSLLCLFLIWLYGWGTTYVKQQPKSEIHRLFEEGIRRHLQKLN